MPPRRMRVPLARRVPRQPRAASPRMSRIGSPAPSCSHPSRPARAMTTKVAWYAGSAQASAFASAKHAERRARLRQTRAACGVSTSPRIAGGLPPLSARRHISDAAFARRWIASSSRLMHTRDGRTAGIAASPDTSRGCAIARQTSGACVAGSRGHELIGKASAHASSSVVERACVHATDASVCVAASA